MPNKNYNIAVIGQTGVGKSTLINYLFGEKVRDSGVGRPVTKNGFHRVDHQIQGMPVTVYDSWGLEVGKLDQWIKELEQEIKERGVEKPSTDWFHSVFYCISASSARIQDADLEIIKFMMDKHYKVSIVLTKADALTEEDEKIFIAEIRKELGMDMAIIPVCSEHKKTRGGEIRPFGKEEIEAQSIRDLLDSLISWVPRHCEYKMMDYLDTWCNEKKVYILENTSVFIGKDNKEIHNELSEEIKNVNNKINQIFQNEKNSSINHYKFIAENINSQLRLYGFREEDIGLANVKSNDKPWSWWEIPVFIAAIPLMLLLSPFLTRSIRNDYIRELEYIIDKFHEDSAKVIKARVQTFAIDLSRIKNMENDSTFQVDETSKV